MSIFISLFAQSDDGLYMERPNLEHILQNLTNIRELYLDFVNNSAIGSRWGEVLSISLPHLQVLSMTYCQLRGKIHKSLAKLKHLSVIKLSDNQLDGPIPEFIAMFQNLTTLALSSCDLTGIVPAKIFQLPTLRTIDLSGNIELTGEFPVFYKNGSLEELDLSQTSFDGVLQASSISNLKKLRKLYLYDCQFHGSIPSSLASLTLLEHVELSENQFSGPIPSFSSAKNLNYLDLSNNNLSGPITATQWENIHNLTRLFLSNNALDGSIPVSLFSLPSLTVISLEHNKFTGQLKEFESTVSSKLIRLDLGNNYLEGPFNKSIFQLSGLTILGLSSNKLTGTLNLCEFLHSFKILSSLDLSDNFFSIESDGCVLNSSFPQLLFLNLASCKLRVVPEFLKNQTALGELDLSRNQISGTVPGWIWGITVRSTIFSRNSMNLSSNHIVHLEPPLPFANSSIALWFNLNFHSNNLQGKIPMALCNATQLQLVNLEHNHLEGTIPDCLIAKTTVNVLNLRRNNLGLIPDKFGNKCSLQTLDLNGNFFQGWMPSSLANCESLKVLDVGNNQMNDTFPCHLKGLSNLQVLVLRSNNFHGTVVCLESHSNFPLLQIIDLAYNHFSGELNAKIFLKWTSMTAGMSKLQPKLDSLLSNSTYMGYYQNQVTVTFKNNNYELQYILRILNSIDFSNNAFHGELPREVGNLNALVVLNLSHNSFSGKIPSSIGNLTQIESLDLSCNTFSGMIPPQFATLNFLEYLNVSFNKLSGKIPTSIQLQSFDATSFEGNQGLYGPPLTPNSRHKPDPGTYPWTPSQRSNWSSKNELEWIISGAEVGFPVGITVFIGPLIYIKRWRKWYCKQLLKLVMKIMRKEVNARGSIRAQPQRNIH